MQRSERLMDRSSGFTLVELLVGMLMLSLVTGAFYQVLFSGARGSDTSRSVARISEEARLGLNRMIRDTRQAAAIKLATSSGYAIEVDFNGDGSITPSASAAGGDYEQLTFLVSGGSLYIEACAATEGLDCGRQKSVLATGISAIPGTAFFTYSSNRLEYDCNNDGVALKAELEDPACTVTGLTTGLVLAALTDIDYAFQVAAGDRSTQFLSHAEMRNLR